MFFIIFISSLPYLLIYFALRYVIKRHNKSSVTFNVDTDLEYYREKLNGISPATISLLIDLSLEQHKDLESMKLYYDINEVCFIKKNDKLVLNNPNNIKLDQSDYILLNYFYDGNESYKYNKKHNYYA